MAGVVDVLRGGRDALRGAPFFFHPYFTHFRGISLVPCGALFAVGFVVVWCFSFLTAGDILPCK